MTPILVTTAQCIAKLNDYATAEVRSWNPFNLFKKYKLKNHHCANEIANILRQESLSDADLLTIAKTIDKFEDEQLQQDLLFFLYNKIQHEQNLFAISKRNIKELTQVLHHLLNTQYSPWWTLFLIQMPYYSSTFMHNIQYVILGISELFQAKRIASRRYLINVYSNAEMIEQITAEYHQVNDMDKKKELNSILDISLHQTQDHTQKQLVNEIKEILKTIPGGEILISVTFFSYIMTTYLSKPENKAKSTKEQAQDILYLIGKIILKIQGHQLANSLLPGFGEIGSTLASVISSSPPANPLDTEKKMATAIASAAGGAMGGVIGGTVIPVVGSYFGAYLGSVIGQTAAVTFYKTLEDWQKAPKGPGSIVPRPLRSYLVLVDNEDTNILQPLYKRYCKTETECKRLGAEIAKWLSIYIILQNSNDINTAQYLEVIDDEMNKLKKEFIKLKNSHSSKVDSLYKKKSSQRIKEYAETLKPCLNNLQKPITGMLEHYFSPHTKAAPTNVSNSDLPAKDIAVPGHSLNFFAESSDGTAKSDDVTIPLAHELLTF